MSMRKHEDYVNQLLSLLPFEHEGFSVTRAQPAPENAPYDLTAYVADPLNGLHGALSAIRVRGLSAESAYYDRHEKIHFTEDAGAAKKFANTSLFAPLYVFLLRDSWFWVPASKLLEDYAGQSSTITVALDDLRNKYGRPMPGAKALFSDKPKAGSYLMHSHEAEDYPMMRVRNTWKVDWNYFKCSAPGCNVTVKVRRRRAFHREGERVFASLNNSSSTPKEAART
jgi:hypothetical protein